MSVKSYFLNKFNSVSDNANRLIMFCPLCNYVKKKTFSVYLDSLQVHCFHAGCNYHKSVIEFVCEYEGITMKEAFVLIGEESFVKIKPEQKRNSVKLPEYYTPLTNVGYYGQIAWDYVTNVRGINPQRIEEYLIGFGDKNGTLVVIFPVLNELFEIVYYVEREVGSKKYNFPKLKENELGKSKVLFGLQYAAHEEFIVICEGVFDALSIGFNAVALLGKTASEDQIMLLKSLNKTFIIALDSDAFKSACKLCSQLKGQKQVELARLPKGKDPGDLGNSALSYVLTEKEPFTRSLRWKQN